MNKNLISIIVFVILFVFFINGLYESYTSRNLDHLAYVLALGIDVGENAKMKITVQFSKPAIFNSDSGSSSEDSGLIFLVSGEADSIFSGLNLINTYIGRELNLAHCSIVVFSEEIAKLGISTQICSLMNNEEFRPSTNIVVSRCDAYDYLDNAKPNLEKLTVQYFDTFSITNKFTGYFPNVTIGNFFNSFSSDINSSIAILGGLNATSREKESDSSDKNSSQGTSSSSSNDSSNSNDSQQSTENEPSNVITNPKDLIAGSSSLEGKRGAENMGIAVFKDDKLCGELTATETICHLLIQNNLSSCIINVENPINDYGDQIELSLHPNKKSKIVVNVKDDIPYINIELSLDVDILTLEDNIDYESKEVLEKYSSSAKEYLQGEFKNYFNKVSKEYNTDIDFIGQKVLSTFSTISEWKDFNWLEKYKNAEFNVLIEVNVISSLLLTKS